MGLDTDEYRVMDAVDAGWTGMAEVSLEDAELDELYEAGRPSCPPPPRCRRTPAWCCCPPAAPRSAG
ncbi:hypothetical protein [Blastococcus brunescens]|uniref:Uncharacterized protein n=1 Tax=Blastococcus brunescens TaxID=1564165 RepID=A0ABZ1B4L1_9ACTN|nr:hypothetical protein [Blastococcus sp. BMG 8361]WRL64763.1 hypothetical protein U6N30_03070 [Blastococcus sp. BMG 8361]